MLELPTTGLKGATSGFGFWAAVMRGTLEGMVGRALGFLIVRRVLGILGLGRSPDDKDIEIAVLRRQIGVLNRQVRRPRFTVGDRLILATLSRVLPRDGGRSSLSHRRRYCGGTVT